MDDDIFEPSKSKKLRLETDDGGIDNAGGNGNVSDDADGTQEYLLDDEVADTLQQDTQPYSLDSSNVENGHADTNGRNDTPTFKSSDDRGDGEDGGVSKGEGTDNKVPVKPSLNKIESVLRDAQLIAGIISGVEVSDVYEKLKERRQNPNRVDIVTNELLEASKVVKDSSGEGSSAATVLEDFVKVIDKAMNNLPTLPLTADEIHQLLNKYRHRADRVDFVVSQILVRHYRKGDHQKADLVEDVAKVMSLLPEADSDMVCKVVEENQYVENRVQKALEILKQQVHMGASMRKEDSFPNDPKLHNDPIYRDMRIISKVVTNRDRNEIYAFLEAHHEKKNRIKVVIEELLKTGDSGSLESSIDGHSTSAADDAKTGVGAKLPKNIQEEVDELREIFPDCDPNYLYEELEKRNDDKERLKNVAMFMFDNTNYPKLKDVNKGQQKEKVKQKFQDMTLDIEEYLMKFPTPDETFFNEEKQMNENYKEHSLRQLLSDFKNLKKGYIKDVLKSHNFHYAPTKKEVWTDSLLVDLDSKRFRRHPREDGHETRMPEEPNDFFYHEKLFLDNEKRITDHLKEKKRLREMRIEEAKLNMELMECECCYDDECLFEDMSACAEGHLFCKDCIRRSSEVVIGQGKTEFPCLTGTCPEHFPLSVLQSVLPTNIFSIALSKMQEAEIKMADIPGLVSCPFCSFATIMPDENDKVFKCLNPDCLKKSCRLCQEPNHIPFRCDEIEKQGETSMRTYIETKVTEAMLRKCHRCKKTFVKDTGCNKMTCTCGATSCYVCRAPDIDYEHFDDNESCNVTDDSNVIHKNEMIRAAEEARQQYIVEHPDAADIHLKYDPLEHIEQFEQNAWNDDEYDEEDY